jgi:hypothetical protein
VSVWGEIVKAKLGLIGRIWREEMNDENVEVVLKIRLKQVADGDTSGLIGEVYGLLDDAGQLEEMS